MLTKGIVVGRLFGVKLTVDWGLSILLVLLTFNLGAGLLPTWHPDWGPVLTWGLAFGAALLFLLSVLLHELAHAVVGRIFEIPITTITLFIFGGAANMEDEPPSPKAELWMAAAGPVMSLVIGVACTLGAIPGTAEAMNAHQGPMATLGALGPVTTLLLWLGPTNLVLFVFNMVPAFPLDGGRILRAVLWYLTRDMLRATRWAVSVGRGFAWLLLGSGGAMLVGAKLPGIGGSFAQGVWFIFLGWFLNSAATLSYRRLAVREVLGRVPVSELMRSEVTLVTPELDLESFSRDIFLQSDQRAFPVVEGERLVGLVSKVELDKVPRARWAETKIGEVMLRGKHLLTVSPDDDTAKAFLRLAGQDAEQVAVVKDGRVHGLLRRHDILRWLQARSGSAPA